MTDTPLIEAQRRSCARFTFDTAYAADGQIKRLRTLDMHASTAASALVAVCTPASLALVGTR